MKKISYKPLSEAVRDPLLEVLFDRVRLVMPFHVAQHDPQSVDRTEPAQRVGRLERVVKEPAVVMNAGEPWDRNEFRPENLVPEIFDRLDFREEAVAADVEPKAFVLRGPGNPADDVVGFENRDPGKPLLREHVGRRQARGPGTNHNHAIAGPELGDRARATRGRHYVMAMHESVIDPWQDYGHRAIL